MAENPRAPDRAVEAGRGAIFISAAKVFFIVSGFVQQVLLPRLLGWQASVTTVRWWRRSRC